MWWGIAVLFCLISRGLFEFFSKSDGKLADATMGPAICFLYSLPYIKEDEI